MAKIDPLVAIGLPTWGKVSVSWAQAFRHLGGPLGANTLELAPVVGKPIAQARNELMQAAFANKADFLFMLGDDVLAPADTIIKMLHRMWDDPNLSLLTGMYWTKHWPAQPYIWRGVQRGPYMDWKYGEFFELDYAGCDCLLIRLTDEMKALGPEWFSTDWKWDRADGPAMIATEDFFFYTKTRKAGIKLWCDSTVQCIHEDRNSGMQFALTTDMPQYSGASVTLPDAGTDLAPLVKVADIGCGFDTPFFGTAEQVKVFRFDLNEKARPDYRCDIRHLPVPDQSFDIVHSKHVLEHFGRGEIMDLMKEWARVLRIGGEFRLSVPNLIHAITKILLMDEGVIPVDGYPWWQLYGKQDDERDVHKNGFTPNRLRALFDAMGIFEDIEVTTANGDSEDLNIFVKAKKARHLEPSALLPEWDVIRAAEGIVIKGMAEEPVKVKKPRRAHTNGVQAEPEAVPV
ncbi:MAG: methyltransferase domain-containing protein [Candidatus Nanopelagicales bacterium]|nr:methyltransferase domain-containing protein [Candidatus Nanopelagicales bacterium]